MIKAAVSSAEAQLVPDARLIDTSRVQNAMQRMRASAYAALARYRPRFYHGEIKFVRAEISTRFPADAAAVWAPLAEKIEVTTVPGDHLGIIATHYESLASVLSCFLAKAFSDSPGK